MTTEAVPLNVLREGALWGTGQPLCPSCKIGRLHPYRVMIPLGVRGWGLANVLVGWVAICVGDADAVRMEVEAFARDEGSATNPPCGFTLPMQAR